MPLEYKFIEYYYYTNQFNYTVKVTGTLSLRVANCHLTGMPIFVYFYIPDIRVHLLFFSLHITDSKYELRIPRHG